MRRCPRVEMDPLPLHMPLRGVQVPLLGALAVVVAGVVLASSPIRVVKLTGRTRNPHLRLP